LRNLELEFSREDAPDQKLLKALQQWIGVALGGVAG
jgi:hypothetical protein